MAGIMAAASGLHERAPKQSDATATEQNLSNNNDMSNTPLVP